MAMKNTAEVVIGGKVYRISGYESPDYLHQVAVYINEKQAEFQKMPDYRKQNTDQRQLLLDMNIADDFFKAKRQADKLQAEMEKKDREIYGVRHDLIEEQLKVEKLQKEIEEKDKEIKKLKEHQGTAKSTGKTRQSSGRDTDGNITVIH